MTWHFKGHVHHVTEPLSSKTGSSNISTKFLSYHQGFYSSPKISQRSAPKFRFESEMGGLSKNFFYIIIVWRKKKSSYAMHCHEEPPFTTSWRNNPGCKSYGWTSFPGNFHGMCFISGFISDSLAPLMHAIGFVSCWIFWFLVSVGGGLKRMWLLHVACQRTWKEDNQGSAGEDWWNEDKGEIFSGRDWDVMVCYIGVSLCIVRK